ncbi:hypothetical protein MNV49_005993 [Pseudohyphozyma bogoriensis]|nr:hypothetical protein MNV49_005993 [Pseudohyphozyma bogoriensis]
MATMTLAQTILPPLNEATMASPALTKKLSHVEYGIAEHQSRQLPTPRRRPSSDQSWHILSGTGFFAAASKPISSYFPIEIPRSTTKVPVSMEVELEDEDWRGLVVELQEGTVPAPDVRGGTEGQEMDPMKTLEREESSKGTYDGFVVAEGEARPKRTASKERAMSTLATQVDTSIPTFRDKPPPLPRRSPSPPRRTFSDRAGDLPSLRLSDYDAYLSNTPTPDLLSRDYLHSQVHIMLEIQPATELWDQEGTKRGFFGIHLRDTWETDVRRFLPNRKALGPLKRREGGVIDGKGGMWNLYMRAIGMMWDVEHVGWEELRWVVSDAPLPVYGLVKAWGDFERYREGIRFAWRRLHMYLCGILHIQLNKPLHRGLELVEWFFEEGEGEVARRRIDRVLTLEKEGRQPAWKVYLAGGDEQMVERLKADERGCVACS